MERRLVGHRELSHVAGVVWKFSKKRVLASAQRGGEHPVEFLAEALRAPHQGNQAGNVVLHIPAVDPGVVFVIVFPCPHSSGEVVVYVWDEVPFLVTRMEEEGLGIEKLLVIGGLFKEPGSIPALSCSICKLRKGPAVVGCPEAHGNRLALLKAMDIRIGLRFPLAKGRDITVLPVEIIKPACRLAAPWCQGLLGQRPASGFIGGRDIDFKAFSQGIGKRRDRVVAVHPP